MSGAARSLRVWALAAALAAGCSHAGQRPLGSDERSGPPAREKPGAELGLASYYARNLHGRVTASGEPYDRHELTAAHRRLPFGTLVRVTDVESGRSVVVKVNDRGPFAEGRVIDLSYAAARVLGILERGVARVWVEPVRAD